MAQLLVTNAGTYAKDLSTVVSEKPGLNEDEYLALVERIQQAMCIEPFHLDMTDVVVLIGTCRVLDGEIKRLWAVVETASAMVKQTDPNLADALLRRLDQR